MAKFRGNIWTKAAGSIGSITFSKARNRDGKIQTARERVVPLNPQTPGQVSARQELASSNFIAKDIGPSLYESDWDRAISKLPGYQSLVSTMQRASQSVGTDILVNRNILNIPLGGLHVPQIITFAHVTGTVWEVNWSTELGSNGTADDPFILFGIQPTIAGTDVATRTVVTDSIIPTRSDASWEVDMGGATGTDTEVTFLFWLQPASTNPFRQPSAARVAYFSP